MSGLAVRTMTDVEFHQWQDDMAVAYAEEQVASGRWDNAGAVGRARAVTEQFLPDGQQTPRMLLLQSVRTGSGESVGRAWVGLDHPQGVAHTAFLYHIEIFASLRGQGLGAELLAAVELTARTLGATAMELNVFGRNDVANRLYASGGYDVTSQQMRKQW